jgi:hypothetical protein
VQDKQTKEALVGATIQVTGTTIGTTTDLNGQFVLERVPLGRVSIQCQYIGYASYVQDDILLSSTREVYLEIGLVSSSVEVGEVVVSATRNAYEAVNTLSVVSARSFTAEETDRVAAGINDPGRVALSFPGVKQGPDENENAIIVRGNSPVGILWRVEGIDVPNPNHFALIGSSVGGVNVFSAQLLSRSDFSSGGMAAEYGNAISGAFDMHFRQGNNERREHRVKVGIIGLDFATEGYFKKGKSSYLVNYRYSTLGLLNKIGFNPIGERVSNDFQDLSFNLSFKNKSGNIRSTVFGIGGLSLEQYFPVENPVERDTAVFNNREYQYRPGKMGAVGSTMTFLLNPKSYLKAVVALMGSDIRRQFDTLDLADNPYRYHNEQFTDLRLSTSLTYSMKFNEKISLKSGLIAHQIFFNFARDVEQLSSINNISNIERGGSVQGEGNTQQIQQFTQASFNILPRLSANVGYHLLYLNANKSYSVDPRVSMQYSPTVNQKISFAYGLQSQVLPLMTYYLKDSTQQYINRDLDLLKAHHFVLAYHLYTKGKMKISMELYYQKLLNVPVRPDVNDNYWMLNNTNGYPLTKVLSQGTGENYGVDIAVEKMFAKSYFILATASLYEAKFRPFNGKTYNSRWASIFSSSLTFGKEFNFKKDQVLQVGGRVLFNGNAPYTPYDPTLSQQQGTYVPLADADNSAFLPLYFRMDMRLQYRYNTKKLAGSISLDIQNVFNRINATGVAYDATSNTTYVQYRGGGLIPVLALQFDF